MCNADAGDHGRVAKDGWGADKVILGFCPVTFSRRAINSLQTTRCCSLALEAM